MTTKKQEREALEQIKNIIESLGPDSYIAVALEGCLDIAAENIDNDFACSMKQRAETARAQVETLKAENRELRETIGEKEKKIDKQRDALSQLNGIIRQLEGKTLTRDLYKAIWTVAYDKADESKALMMNAASMMADHADTPQDIAFQESVKCFKKWKKDAESAAWIMDQIEKIKPDGC